MESLPLPEPYCSMWQKFKKIIDGLHLSNHKKAHYKTAYSLKTFEAHFGKEVVKNTMVAEQTISWLVKLSKQLNSMTKEHQILFIHGQLYFRIDTLKTVCKKTSRS